MSQIEQGVKLFAFQSWIYPKADPGSLKRWLTRIRAKTHRSYTICITARALIYNMQMSALTSEAWTLDVPQVSESIILKIVDTILACPVIWNLSAYQPANQIRQHWRGELR